MSIATKRKFVRQLAGDLFLPGEKQFFVRTIVSRGNNLHEVETADGEKFLVSMPPKFRKSVWIKRGDFLLCDPIAEGDKVKGEICQVLHDDNIRYIKKAGQWPAGFGEDVQATSKLSRENSSAKAESSDDGGLDVPSSSSSESDRDGDDEEDYGGTVAQASASGCASNLPPQQQQKLRNRKRSRGEKHVTNGRVVSANGLNNTISSDGSQNNDELSSSDAEVGVTLAKDKNGSLRT